MAEDENNGRDVVEIPASLRPKQLKEPAKLVHLRIPLSWWEELSGLAREFDQNVSTFLREATDDWLKRVRKVQQQQHK